MKLRIYLSILFTACAASMFALEETDRNSINGIIEHFTNVWNHNSGKDTAKYYASDADFVNIFGMLFSGKQEIEKRHVQIHETFLKDSIYEIVDLKVREAKPDVVIAQEFWKVSNIKASEQKTLPETIKGVFTHTFVKNGHNWEIASTQNTLISK